ASTARPGPSCEARSPSRPAEPAPSAALGEQAGRGRLALVAGGHDVVADGPLGGVGVAGPQGLEQRPVVLQGGTAAGPAPAGQDVVAGHWAGGGAGGGPAPAGQDVVAAHVAVELAQELLAASVPGDGGDAGVELPAEAGQLGRGGDQQPHPPHQPLKGPPAG